jgi:hypothetical protein
MGGRTGNAISDWCGDTIVSFQEAETPVRRAQRVTDGEVEAVRHLSSEALGENTLQALSFDSPISKSGSPLRPAPPLSWRVSADS